MPFVHEVPWRNVTTLEKGLIRNGGISLYITYMKKQR